MIRSRASSIPNHAARSTSGNSRTWPERGGQSAANVLLLILVGLQSPSTAQASMVLPPGCLIGASDRKAPDISTPVSSTNSRRAASRGSSPGVNSPLGMDQAPRSSTAKGPSRVHQEHLASARVAPIDQNARATLSGHWATRSQSRIRQSAPRVASLGGRGRDPPRHPPANVDTGHTASGGPNFRPRRQGLRSRHGSTRRTRNSRGSPRGTRGIARPRRGGLASSSTAKNCMAAPPLSWLVSRAVQAQYRWAPRRTRGL